MVPDIGKKGSFPSIAYWMSHLKPLFRLEEGMLHENFASARSLLHFFLVNRELSDLERDKMIDMQIGFPILRTRRAANKPDISSPFETK